MTFTIGSTGSASQQGDPSFRWGDDFRRRKEAVIPAKAGIFLVWKPPHASNFSRAIFSFHTSGASWWTFAPSLSTATVTGKSLTSNS
ncbi:hypothetical protein BH10PSE14_BH10PSE14_44220 [soil metagenome]